ncbi:hypothetical protein JCM18916_3023 [Cutibacterium acnes JCM 18916]|nr:hypothetical protein JCM18916_3023 [Cutibacterium acnes JCM 18916]
MLCCQLLLFCSPDAPKYHQGPVKRADGPRAAARESIDVAPHPPADGASIDLVVGGFLQAMASVRDDYRVARSYLTSDIADRWDPHAKVTIYDATNHKPASTVATAALQAPVVGQIDSRGHYHPTSSQTLNHDFGMAQESGQWRISRPPEGVLISQYTFQRSWSTIPIYFFDRGGGPPRARRHSSSQRRRRPRCRSSGDDSRGSRASRRGAANGLAGRGDGHGDDVGGCRRCGHRSVECFGGPTVAIPAASVSQPGDMDPEWFRSDIAHPVYCRWLSAFASGGGRRSKRVRRSLRRIHPLSRYPLTDRGRRHQGQMGRVAASGHNFRIMPGALGRGATTNNSVAEVASTQFTMPMISRAAQVRSGMRSQQIDVHCSPGRKVARISRCWPPA